MKAYWATSQWEEWGFYVHGETVGGAKSRAKRCDPSGEWEWTDIRVRRQKALDDKPFTSENCNPLVAWAYDDGEQGEYINECDCEICAAATEKKR